MSEIKILLEVTRNQQIEIEDICHRDGLTISNYLLGLHEGEKVRRMNRKSDLDSNEREEVENKKSNDIQNKKKANSKKPEQFKIKFTGEDD